MPALPVPGRPAKPYCGQMNSFSCVSISFRTGWSQLQETAALGSMELTRQQRASTLAREDTSSSWTNGRKDCVSWPRGCHPGVFSGSRQEQPLNELHAYRRITV